MATQVWWIGPVPTRSDLSGESLTAEGEFVDGYVRAAGIWGIMTVEEHEGFGSGLGTGRGQLFRRQPDGRWLKVEG